MRDTQTPKYFLTFTSHVYSNGKRTTEVICENYAKFILKLIRMVVYYVYNTNFFGFLVLWDFAMVTKEVLGLVQA